MELVRIPKVSFWSPERPVFNSLEVFLELAERLYRHPNLTGNQAAPVEILRKLTYVERYSVEPLNELFFALRDAAFMYSQPQGKLPVSNGTTLFKTYLSENWRRKKLLLKQLIKKHGEPYQKLRDLQLDCWTSRDDVKEYDNMYYAASCSIMPCNSQEFPEHMERLKAVKAIRKELEKRREKNSRNLQKYNSAFQKEKAARYIMLQTAGPLEFDIVSRMRKKITEACEKLEQVAPGSVRLDRQDIARISEHLYSITCKTYTFRNAESSQFKPEFNERLTRAYTAASTVDLSFDDMTYATHNYRVTAISDTYSTDESYLPLKKGDVIKMKIVSRDQTTGYGWIKKSKFSMKKWGFFKISNIQLYPETLGRI